MVGPIGCSPLAALHVMRMLLHKTVEPDKETSVWETNRKSNLVLLSFRSAPPITAPPAASVNIRHVNESGGRGTGRSPLPTTSVVPSGRTEPFTRTRMPAKKRCTWSSRIFPLSWIIACGGGTTKARSGSSCSLVPREKNIGPTSCSPLVDEFSTSTCTSANFVVQVKGIPTDGWPVAKPRLCFK